MAAPHVITALSAKRAELAGELLRAEGLVLRLCADLSTLDATIRLFDPSATPEKIRPVLKRRKPVTFRYGELTRTVLGILRRAHAPMTLREIACAVAAQHGLDKEPIARLAGRVREVVTAQKPGTLVREQRGKAAAWRVA